MKEKVFYETEDLKEEFMWLAYIEKCSLVGYHTKFACLRCPEKYRCRDIDPRVRELRLKDVLREGVPVLGEPSRPGVTKSRSSSGLRRRGKELGKKIEELLRQGKSTREIKQLTRASYTYINRVRKRIESREEKNGKGKVH